ncbi:DUF455 family protein [Burkholderia sp. GS2Y]|uniref:DUF455 family protein n=1 Tax=Burkholderia theae TaxID=3143496 RepID=A0ABU9WBZ7_9BURK
MIRVTTVENALRNHLTRELHRWIELGELIAYAAITSSTVETKIALGSALHDVSLAIGAVLTRARNIDVELIFEEERRLVQTRLEAAKTVVSDVPSLIHRLQQELASPVPLAPFDADQLLGCLDQPTRDLAQFLSAANAKIQTAIEALPAQERLSGSTSSAIRWPGPIALPKAPGRASCFSMGNSSAGSTQGPQTPTANHEMAIRFHRTLMSLEIPTIEACAQNILDRHPYAYDFYRDIAKQSYDEARHAAAFIIALKEVGYSVGDFPISVDLWELTHEHPLPLRLAIHQRIGETIGFHSALWWSEHLESNDNPRLSALYDIIYREEISHVERGNYWLRRFCYDDDAGIAEIVEQAYAVRMNQTGNVIDGQKKYPWNVDAMRKAGYTAEEVSEHLSR